MGLVRIGRFEFNQSKDAFFSWRFVGVVNQVLNEFPLSRGYGSAAGAEDVASWTDGEYEGGHVKELVAEVWERDDCVYRRKFSEGNKNVESGISSARYKALRRRQVKIETEAWDRAANEYRELLKDMCERKLAPNLPYMKSLFLGWFQPFRDAILADQESKVFASHKATASYAPYMSQLPADLMAVITMHKLMGLLMTGNDGGRTRVVHAACAIGEAIEHEVSKVEKLSEINLFADKIVFVTFFSNYTSPTIYTIYSS